MHTEKFTHRARVHSELKGNYFHDVTRRTALISCKPNYTPAYSAYYRSSRTVVVLNEKIFLKSFSRIGKLYVHRHHCQGGSVCYFESHVPVVLAKLSTAKLLIIMTLWRQIRQKTLQESF